MFRTLIAAVILVAEATAHASDSDETWLQEVKCSANWISIPTIKSGIVTLRKKDIAYIDLYYSDNTIPKEWRLNILALPFRATKVDKLLLPHLYTDIFQCLGME